MSWLRFVAALGAALALGWAVHSGGRLAWQRWRGRRHARRGQRGERLARALLERAGYSVLAEQPRRTIRLRVSGKQRSYEVIPDFLCERAGERFVADAKTGAGADPLTSATRRQLLEYASAFGVDLALVIDVPRAEILRVDLRPLRQASRRGASSMLVVLFVLAGIGAWLLAQRSARHRRPQQPSALAPSAADASK